VEVAPAAEPPVCRIMDFGKFVYERAKKEREARKAQTKIEVKEIRLRQRPTSIIAISKSVMHAAGCWMEQSQGAYPLPWSRDRLPGYRPDGPERGG